MATIKFGGDFDRKMKEAAREGARDMALEAARDVRREMGAAAKGITYKWVVEKTGNKAGRLSISGPDDATEKFEALFRKKMGQK